MKMITVDDIDTLLANPPTGKTSTAYNQYIWTHISLALL
jgi:hypothetical protein